MGEIAHVEYVFDLSPLGLVGAEEESFVVADGQQMQEGVEMRCGCEVKAGAQMPPAVLVGLVFPELLLSWLVPPKRQIFEDFAQKRNDDIGCIGYLLTPSQSYLIRHHKICK